MEAEVMTLGNRIAQKTKQYDEIEAEKGSLMNNEEETSAKKWEQISQLSQVISAIDNIEDLCSAQGFLTYRAKSIFFRQEAAGFDSFSVCEPNAEFQLTYISQFMKDFDTVL